MKIWVTGGNGSLGTALVSTLTLQFPDVEIYAPPRTDLDLSDPKEVLDFVTKTRPTHIFHLAAKVYGIRGHSSDPMGSLLANTLIDYSVFNALLKFPPVWVYYSSTVAAYGYPYVRLPLKESDWLSGEPHSSEYGYGMAKRHAFSYLRSLEKNHEVKFVYGLTTNLFGNGDRFLNGKGHVVISLLERAKESLRNDSGLEVWGTGMATRDFLSVDDAARIIIELIDVHAELLNIASGTEISIRTLAEVVVENFGISKGLSFTGDQEGITQRWCDISKLRTYSEAILKVDSLLALKRNIVSVARGSSN
jgi:GDP-L-fucose synthase